MSLVRRRLVSVWHVHVASVGLYNHARGSNIGEVGAKADAPPCGEVCLQCIYGTLIEDRRCIYLH